MKPYPAYKDSRIEWLGEVPEHWNKSQLKYVTRFVNGAAFKPADWSDFGVPIIRIENLNGGKDFNYYDGDINPKYHVEKGALLFSWSGNIGTSFGPFLWEHEGLFYLNQHIFRLENFDLDKEYFYWLLKAVTSYVESKTHGIIGLVHITKQELGCIEIPKISRYEQQSIATFLDQKTSQIDTLIEKKQKQIELLKEERTAIINHVVTKGLNPDVPMKDSGIEWLGEVPELWEIKPLKYVTKINESALTENTDENYILQYIDIGNVGQGYLLNPPTEMAFANAPSRARRILNKGDVIISTVRTYLKAIAYIDSDDNNLIASTGFATISATNKIDSKYLFFLLSSQKFIDTVSSISVGVSYPAVTSSQISLIPVWYPFSIEEQKEIVKFIETNTFKINNIVANIEKQITRLQEYRTALISDAVTGKIDVRNHHGNPA